MNSRLLPKAMFAFILTSCIDPPKKASSPVSAIIPDTAAQEQGFLQANTDSVVETFNAKANRSGYSDPWMYNYKQVLNYVKINEDSAQEFCCKTDKPANIVCNSGTQVSFHPNDLEGMDENEKFIKVKITECFDKNAMLRSGVQTVSCDRALTAEAAIRIHITSGKNICKLKKKKYFTIKFPQKISSGMTVFYAMEDSLGRMFSTPSGQLIEKWQTIANNTHSKYYYFTDDTAITGCCMRFAKIRSSKLQWRRECKLPGKPMFADTIGFSAFSKYIYRGTNFFARTWFIPIHAKMVPLENIRIAEIDYVHGEKSSTLKIGNYEKEEVPLVTECKAVDLEQLGWILVGKEVPCKKTVSLRVLCKDTNVPCGAIFLVLENYNSIFMKPFWGKKNENSKEAFLNLPYGYPLEIIGYFQTKKGIKKVIQKTRIGFLPEIELCIKDALDGPK